MLRSMMPGLALSLIVSILAPGAARASQVAVATYQFQNTLAADQSGVASLTAVNPLGTSEFVTNTLFGQTRQVYAFNGSSNPADQGGLTVNTTNLISPTSYSVEMVLSFNAAGPTGWTRILDVQNRQSDNGFYVDPSNHLDVFPVASGTTEFTYQAYHVVHLTVGGGVVDAYLDGNLEFSASTAVMNITDTIDNPNNLMGFFLDNVVGGGQGEWAPGNVALIQLYNGVLDQSQITMQASNPFGGLSAVPEPSSAVLLGLGVAGGLVVTRGLRRRAR
jgi:PEP-CTERM motif